MRRAFTLPELMSAVVIALIMASIVVPPLAHTLDRIAVDEAVDRYAALHETTRELAVAKAGLARLEIDTAQRSITLSWRSATQAWDTIATRPLGSAQVATTQPAVTFTPYGFGWGLSNTRIILSRGHVAETLTVSRTGRLKRG